MREIMKICSVSYFEQALGCLLVPIAFHKDRHLSWENIASSLLPNHQRKVDLSV